MSLNPAIFRGLHAVLGFPAMYAQDQERDQRLISAVRSAFPIVTSHVALSGDAPTQAPHLVVASTSSQAALSRVQADFEVRFYDTYLHDVRSGLEYTREKIATLSQGLASVGIDVTTIGVIATLNFATETTRDAVEHIATTHLRTSTNPSLLENAGARLAFKVADTYFVNLAVSNYESRVLERPIIPGAPFRIRPWEGRIEEVGIELVVDVNNGLASRVQEQDVLATPESYLAALDLVEGAVTRVGPGFVSSGIVDLADFTAERAKT